MSDQRMPIRPTSRTFPAIVWCFGAGLLFPVPATSFQRVQPMSFPYLLLAAKSSFRFGWIDHFIRIAVEQHCEWGEFNFAIGQVGLRHKSRPLFHPLLIIGIPSMQHHQFWNASTSVWKFCLCPFGIAIDYSPRWIACPCLSRCQ